MKKLPIGIQTFSEIIKNNYIYIDKTDIALNLIETYKYAFLSRPRRFGKSLFLDTLKNIFQGNKEFFKGLYIYDKWDFKKYPVITISWAGSSFANMALLEEKAKEELKENQKKLGVECDMNLSPFGCFNELIQKVYEKYQMPVVVLIDEYDKPILNVVENLDQAKKHREFIKGFYEVLKDNDEYLKFVFLTGVSKFSKASIFSGLNMISDISLSPKYGNICGYTQNDIETSFKPYLEGVDLKKFKNYYNGYNFLKDPVYNPFDTLQFIENNFLYDNYWFESGTPTFLIKLIEQNNYFLPKLSNVVVGKELLASFDIESINLEVLLYQSGYLTIESVKEKRRGGFEYKLKLPNIEVKQSFNDILIDFLTNQKTEKYQFQDDLYDAIVDGKLELFQKVLKSIFASIPYNNYTNNNISKAEGFYASVVYVYLQSLGFDIIGEDVTNKGRIDLTIKLSDKIYIIEFKVGKDDALSQIKKKKYHEKYQNGNKDIYLIGINFDEKEKNVSKFEWERLYF